MRDHNHTDVSPFLRGLQEPLRFCLCHWKMKTSEQEQVSKECVQWPFYSGKFVLGLEIRDTRPCLSSQVLGLSTSTATVLLWQHCKPGCSTPLWLISTTTVLLNVIFEYTCVTLGRHLYSICVKILSIITSEEKSLFQIKWYLRIPVSRCGHITHGGREPTSQSYMLILGCRTKI